MWNTNKQKKTVRQAGGTAQVLRAAATQTDKPKIRVGETQTNNPRLFNRESQAWRPNVASGGIQTDAPSVSSGGVQTEGPQVFDMTIDDTADTIMNDIQDELDKQKSTNRAKKRRH